MKILKDNINMLVAKAKTTPGGSGQDLTEELGGVLGNYQKLCDRFKSKCHTLEVKSLIRLVQTTYEALVLCCICVHIIQ